MMSWVARMSASCSATPSSTEPAGIVTIVAPRLAASPIAAVSRAR